MLQLTPDAVVEEIKPRIFNVYEINSIQDRYPDWRQKSKTPTFALTYDGTYRTLMTGSGLPEDQARLIYDRYHELYAVSDAWVAKQLEQASKDGYITVAFGLRVRTPLLKQTIRKTRSTPYAAEAEGRSAGNALGQSWCMLNNRAASGFMGQVRRSEFRLDIRPCAHIHDAQYYLFRDDLRVLTYANVHLVKEVYWQEDPAIAHPEVKLGGELSVYYPTWAEECTLANGADADAIEKSIYNHLEKLKKKAK